jgi:hypothetical protein
MPSHARVNGGDSAASGRGRQRLKLAAIGYVNARHGLDTDADLVRKALRNLCQMAVEFVAALSGTQLNNRRVDLWNQGDTDSLKLAAIAYVCARHGVDADVGMSREGLAFLCQAAVDYVESLPKEEPKRPLDPQRQIGGGVRP